MSPIAVIKPDVVFGCHWMKLRLLNAQLLVWTNTNLADWNPWAL